MWVKQLFANFRNMSCNITTILISFSPSKNLVGFAIFAQKNLVGFAIFTQKNLVGFAIFCSKNLVGFAKNGKKNLVGLKNCFIFAFNNDSKNDI